MFLIRADGNAKIGAGHLMRCLTIADELSKLTDSREILFLCADKQSAELAASRGYETFVLKSDPQDMEEELPAWEKILEENSKTHVIIVDSYYVTNRYLREIGKYGYVMLLDDMGVQRFFADGVINYNAFADRQQYENLYRPGNTELILGSDYVPVRPQFREGSYRVRERAENILITTGGGDADNIAGRILQEMKHRTAQMITGDTLNYHLVIGTFSPHFKEMEELVMTSPNIYIYHNVHDMAALMRQCDLAITAGGSTIYELAAVGVPFICFSYAENQEKITEYLGREGIAYFAGAFHREGDVVLGRIAEQACDLSRDYHKRNECYLKIKTLTDGAGAERIAKILIGRRPIRAAEKVEGEKRSD